VEEYNIEEKIPYSKLYNYTKWFITYKTPYLFEDNAYYTYAFDNFKFFKDEYWLYIKSLSNFWDISKYILFTKEDWKYVFLTNYKRIKLVGSDIVYGLPWKYNFLKEVLNDTVPTSKITDVSINDNDVDLKHIKEESVLITKWLNEDDKVKKIYSRILDSISYSKKIDFSNNKIFSWIFTYKNKDGVCTWYSKLFLYMLSFSWIDNVEVMRWNVIDAQDFPDVWHAWIKKWNYYYDPTFDDPVWWDKTLEFTEYKYYKLPKDLFYTNRYDDEETPNDLKTKNLEYRINIVKKNLFYLVNKYKDVNYVLLKPYVFRLKYWFWYDEKITISKIKRIKPVYKVIDNYLEKDWQKKFITNLYYYTLTDDNFEIFLDQFNYNLDNFTFLEWNFWNWQKEYRAWKGIKF
jgi:hypothetical protein